MKTSILLSIILVASFSSCTTAYKTGQTPDDVYFSPARPQDEYVQTQKEDDNRYNNNDEYYDDRYLRMKVRNRNQWSDLDDYYYSRRYANNSYFNNCYNNPWTPYAYWNNYYNPYYNNYTIINPKSVSSSGPRTSNLNTYNNISLTSSNYTNPKMAGSVNNSNNNSNTNSNNTYTGPRNTNNNNANNNSNAGSLLRNIFSGGNNNSNSSNSSNSSHSSSSTNSSSSSSSAPAQPAPSSAPVRKF